MSSWLDDIGSYLESHGIGVQGTDIFYRGFDAEAQNCIALFDHAGLSSIVSLSKDMIIERPELGVLVRNESDTAGEQIAHSIYELLNFLTDTSIGSTRFAHIEAIAPPFFVSQTDSNLFVFSTNFEIEIEK